MDWLHPGYFWALMAVPLVAGLLWYALRARRRALGRLGERALLERLGAAWHPPRYAARAGLLVLAVLLLAGALVGPRYGTQRREVERRGVDLVIALDVSASMQAEDVAPDRLARARRAIDELLGSLRGSRVGLVIFAGDAFIQSPLTTDYNAVRLFLEVAGPELVAVPGTDFGAALRAARRAFRTAAPDGAALPPDAAPRSKALLFISDGENHVGEVEAVRQAAREAGIMLFAAGVGTARGAPIPVYRDGRRAGYKRNDRGETVRTRLEAASLRRLAAEGAYFDLTPGGEALTALPDALRRLEPATVAVDEFETYAEQFQWPLALALLLLLAVRFVAHGVYYAPRYGRVNV